MRGRKVGSGRLAWRGTILGHRGQPLDHFRDRFVPGLAEAGLAMSGWLGGCVGGGGGGGRRPVRHGEVCEFEYLSLLDFCHVLSH